MERRVEARLETQETALVKNLNGAGEAIEAGVADISARGLKLLLPVKLEVNTPVSVRLGERILLGDICYCLGYGGRSVVRGVALTHSISDVEAIRNLMKRLLEAEEEGARPRDRVT